MRHEVLRKGGDASALLQARVRGCDGGAEGEDRAAEVGAGDGGELGDEGARLSNWESKMLINDRSTLASQCIDCKSVLTIADMARKRIKCILWRN